MKAAPARSLAEEGTAFERQLIESARADSIPPASLERLARALAVPGAAPLGSPAAAPSRLAQQGALMKLGAWGLLGVTAATAALFWLAAEPRSSERSASEHLAPSVLEPGVRGGPALETPPPVLATAEPQRPAFGGAGGFRSASLPGLATPVNSHPTSSVERAEPPESTASDRRRRPSAGQRRSAPSGAAHEAQVRAGDAGGLRAELIAVEAIQRALRAGQNNDAERQLAEYARRFPRGELALEAELLRIDLLVARGDIERARSHARELLARADATRYRGRLEALTQRAD